LNRIFPDTIRGEYLAVEFGYHPRDVVEFGDAPDIEQQLSCHSIDFRRETLLHVRRRKRKPIKRKN
jgi:hypothetical protein